MRSWVGRHTLESLGRGGTRNQQVEIADRFPPPPQ